MVHALASPVLAHLSVADMLTVGAPLSREVGDCFLSCSGNFSRDIFFGGWKVAGPLPRRRVGSCPTPLRGGGLLGHVTIAPYSPNTTVVNSRTVWHHALFDDQGGDDGADGGPEDGEIVE